jgi:cellulose synthase/poly-beta-1,6-N-acetylglucosamine synthase-like glycosyltransferase
MVRGLLLAFEVLLAGLIVYNLITALAGWKQPLVAPIGARRQRFRVVVPAHDEEAVIVTVVKDLLSLDYPPDRFSVTVLADRCSDATAELARAAGARVTERSEGEDGKGPALRWLLDQTPLEEGESLVAIDADNRVPSDLLARLADEIDAGGTALQVYLDVSNPDASPLATASALSYWASNRMVQLARHNLGWTADLGGTGMCLTARALGDAGGFGESLAEDQELGVKLLLGGHRVRWLHDVRIADEKPAVAGVAIRQRSRWVSGRRQVARRWVGRLWRQRTPAAWDLALRLVQPSRMGVALASAVVAILSALGVPLWPWWVWAALALVQFLSPIPFLVREGVPRRYLGRYPVMIVLPLLKVLARLVRTQGWYHTPHGSDSRNV